MLPLVIYINLFGFLKELTMNVSAIAQVATTLSNERNNSNISVAVAKLAKTNMETQGAAALQLIESVPKPQGSLGHNIDIKA